jgi:hypothetical protein
MGTNFYRVPTVEEMQVRREKLLDRVQRMKLTPGNIERRFASERGTDHTGFHSFDQYSPWDDFLEHTSVHLGKRSGGWQFAWNHNNWYYYAGKESLIDFVEKGRVVDEYGEEFSPKDFIEMAFNWCPNGWTNESYLKEELIAHNKKPLYPDNYVDIWVDGLRFMNTTEFS